MVVTRALLVGLLAAPTALAGSEIEDLFRSEDYFARIELYRADVHESGQVDIAWDEDAIQSGDPIFVKAVKVLSDKVRIKVMHPAVELSTSITFHLDQPIEGSVDQTLTALRGMMNSVFVTDGIRCKDAAMYVVVPPGNEQFHYYVEPPLRRLGFTIVDSKSDAEVILEISTRRTIRRYSTARLTHVSGKELWQLAEDGGFEEYSEQVVRGIKRRCQR